MTDNLNTLLNEKKEAVVAHEINAVDLSWRERVVVEEHERLSPHLIFEIIRRDGIEELLRPTKALIFSGLAAGILVSFSFLCMAILNSALPDESWAPPWRLRSCRCPVSLTRHFRQNWASSPIT